MHLTPELSRLSKKAARALCLVLALSALTAAGAQGADLVVPHAATHTVSPTAVPQPAPQPSAPSAAPDPSSAADSPSYADEEDGDGPGASPAASDSFSPWNDVGHRAGQESRNTRHEDQLAGVAYDVDELQARFEQMVSQLVTGVSNGSMGDFLTVLDTGAMLQQGKELLSALFQDQRERNPDAAVREILGYSGVSDQVCGGSSFESTNGDLEDPNNGIAFC